MTATPFTSPHLLEYPEQGEHGFPKQVQDTTPPDWDDPFWTHYGEAAYGGNDAKYVIDELEVVLQDVEYDGGDEDEGGEEDGVEVDGADDEDQQEGEQPIFNDVEIMTRPGEKLGRRPKEHPRLGTDDWTGYVPGRKTRRTWVEARFNL